MRTPHLLLIACMIASIGDLAAGITLTRAKKKIDALAETDISNLTIEKLKDTHNKLSAALKSPKNYSLFSGTNKKNVTRKRNIIKKLKDIENEISNKKNVVILKNPQLLLQEKPRQEELQKTVAEETEQEAETNRLKQKVKVEREAENLRLRESIENIKLETAKVKAKKEKEQEEARAEQKQQEAEEKKEQKNEPPPLENNDNMPVLEKNKKK